MNVSMTPAAAITIGYFIGAALGIFVVYILFSKPLKDKRSSSPQIDFTKIKYRDASSSPDDIVTIRINEQFRRVMVVTFVGSDTLQTRVASFSANLDSGGNNFVIDENGRVSKDEHMEVWK